MRLSRLRSADGIFVAGDETGYSREHRIRLDLFFQVFYSHLMTPKSLSFMMSHRFDDSWGLNSRPQQVDMDLAREVLELVNVRDRETEDVLARAFARHRNLNLYGEDKT